MKRLLYGCLFAALALTPAMADEFDSLDTPIGIPEVGTVGTTTVEVLIEDDGCVEDLNVIIEATHTFSGDLEATLTHDDTGTTVMLYDNVGGVADVSGEYIFDDEAADIYPNPGDPIPPGSYLSLEPLDAFDQEAIGGTWTLTIVDTFAGDSGMLTRFALDIDVAAAALECEDTVLFSPHMTKTAFTPSGIQRLYDANGYLYGVDSGEIGLFFNGAALGLPGLDCIHEDDDGKINFSLKTNKVVSTPAGFQNLNAANIYRAEDDGSFTLVFDGSQLGGVDACQLRPFGDTSD